MRVSQEQVRDQDRHLADLRSEEAECQIAADRDRQQERPRENSPSNRCSDYHHTYICGHRDSQQVRDANCWVCKEQGRFC